MKHRHWAPTMGLMAACAASGSAQRSDGVEDIPSADGGPRDEWTLDARDTSSECGEIVQTAAPVARPVDVILIIDNSSSMGDEIAAVVDNISVHFADILAASGIDYRVILLSYHGDPRTNPDGPADRPICIRTPLSGTDCAPIPPAPVNTDRFFHYHVAIDSTDSLEQLLATYNKPDPNGAAPHGWSEWLRTEALQVLLEITDDTSDLSADDFEGRLFDLTPAHFGTLAARDYVFHSIIGIAPKDPGDQAWLAEEPVQGRACETAASSGEDYERLSIQTGGLRFPVCDVDGYDVVFQRISEGVVDSVGISCAFEAPEVPEGSVIDMSRISLTYQTASASPVELMRAADREHCRDGAFYIDGATIRLCDSTCAVIIADRTARLEAHAACETLIF